MMNTYKCPECTFTYQDYEGVVSQEILDHMKNIHPKVWAAHQDKMAELEREFTK